MKYVVRRWTEEDAHLLVPLVLDYLKVAYEEGDDLKPTKGNVDFLIQGGVQLAASGIPTMLAIDSEGKVLGFQLCYPHDPNLELREKILLAGAIYVIPEARDADVAKSILDMVEHSAKAQGYTRLDGSALTESNYKKGQAAGFVSRGLLFSRRIK
jgi:GNAT superfamily N-acetyltransferase